MLCNQSLGTIPRILADDLMILASGINHLTTMQQAINLTHEMLHDMGAVVAPKKSFIYSNQAHARRWYSRHVWPHISTTIPVVRAVRDLGGTINTTGRGYAKVIDSRINIALASLRRFRHLPHEHSVKAQFIKSKVLSSALYGIECAEPSGHMLQRLQSGIATVMGSSSARSSTR